MVFRSILTLIYVFMGCSAGATTSSLNDGPNCFNTTLHAKGFTKDIVYSSVEEMSFYLETFCREKGPLPQKETLAGDVIIFQENDGEISHSAVALADGKILEKNSLYGGRTEAFEGDPSPGVYLVHALKNSLYFKKIFAGSKEHTAKIYSCDETSTHRKRLESLNNLPHIKTLLQFRKVLAEVVVLSEPKDVETAIINKILPHFESNGLLKVLDAPVTDNAEGQYRYALARSAAYQWYLLNCSESLKKYDECYAPHLKKSVELVDTLFEKIDSFNSKAVPVTSAISSQND
ncbi:hypothetical protein QJS83_12900 [Bdellovibrio sp. 22V]|uniref:hypothetical protein n=1 Tax=Bdellovibrio sp. 22V TaxID=3044166 RepID=UPI002542F38F|nr:hypothetical protein [Bdellovibrio sp. 22V]WII71361.1 hypothetical protein QJS83_12900 [Bdellovibrio sp. 22V]